MNENENKARRRTDGIIAKLAMFWDWFDRRHVDEHLVAGFIIWISWRITDWAMNFYMNHTDKTGLEMSAVVAAVMFPWSGAMTYVLKYWFESPSRAPERKDETH